MKIELTRIKVKKGKTERVTEWLKMINDRMPEALATLGDEKMYVETIFREFDGEDEYLYWFDIRGEGGIDVKKSKHDIDKKHVEFWHECIEDEGKRDTKSRIDLNPEVVMIPDRIRKLMQ